MLYDHSGPALESIPLPGGENEILTILIEGFILLFKNKVGFYSVSVEVKKIFKYFIYILGMAISIRLHGRYDGNRLQNQ